MRIRKPAGVGTIRFHNSDIMPDDYEVVFDEDDGRVANIRKDVAKEILKRRDGFEVVGEGKNGRPDDRPPDDAAPGVDPAVSDVADDADIDIDIIGAVGADPVTEPDPETNTETDTNTNG